MDSLGGWPGILSRLSSGHDLSRAESACALGEVLEGNATPAQIAALMFGLRCKGETVEEMSGMVGALLAAATRVRVGPELADRLIDTCGTGGDRSGTINVSTIAALVVAGAGVPVCKHGGRAASSKAGSADLLEALGVAIELAPEGVARCIETAGIGFCFAPRYHSALRHATPVRRELGVPTAFNFLGPLANPARVRRQVVGVGDQTMAAKMCGVLAANGATHVLVVHGSDGLDELTVTGPSTVLEWKVEDPEVRSWVIDPLDLGITPCHPDELKGGDAVTNAGLARAVLAGERGPHRDIVVLNAAAGLVVAGRAAQLAEGLIMAAAAIDDGRAAQALATLVATSQDAAGEPS
ncbi:anthranilate phosphoribosyltransferase [Acidiferrimicrobium sp. IK]|nr:anthranilate phosphoribosyltransferase [Acidiferrimicrobium sp. IK]